MPRILFMTKQPPLRYDQLRALLQVVSAHAGTWRTPEGRQVVSARSVHAHRTRKVRT